MPFFKHNESLMNVEFHIQIACMIIGKVLTKHNDTKQ